MKPLDLDELLRPVPLEHFLDRYLGLDFLHVPGDREKFACLLPWPTLNQILQSPLVSNHIAVVKNGENIPRESYTKHSENSTETIPFYLLAPELTQLLRGGATLVVNGIDAFYEPITLLTQALGRSLQCQVTANMYAAWHADHGFRTHWDNHDVFVLQIHGTKKWKIFGRTSKAFPVREDNYPEIREIAPSAAVWEQSLNPGDLLYMPRGWWHFATPCNEPTVHLTVGIHSLQGSNLITWLSRRLRAHEAIRMDIPLFNTQKQAAFLEALKKAVSEEIASPTLLHDYLTYAGARASLRPWFGLPWSATYDELPESDSFRIFVTVPSAVEFRSVEDTDEVDIVVDQKGYRFGKDAAHILIFLLKEKNLSMGEFFLKWRDRFNREELKSFLIELLRAGFVALREA
jgi:JmjC domain